MEFKSINDLHNWFCKNKGDIVKFHFDLSNCMHLIMDNYQRWSTCCFCDKIKKNGSLCKMQSTFDEKKWLKKIDRIST